MSRGFIWRKRDICGLISSDLKDNVIKRATKSTVGSPKKAEMASKHPEVTLGPLSARLLEGRRLAHDCRSWTGLVAPGTYPPVTLLQARSVPQREEDGISSTVLQKENTTPRKIKLSFSPAYFSGLSVLIPKEKPGERREKDYLSKYYSLWKVCKQGTSTVIILRSGAQKSVQVHYFQWVSQSQEEGRREKISEYIKIYHPFPLYLLTLCKAAVWKCLIEKLYVRGAGQSGGSPSRPTLPPTSHEVSASRLLWRIILFHTCQCSSAPLAFTMTQRSNHTGPHYSPCSMGQGPMSPGRSHCAQVFPKTLCLLCGELWARQTRSWVFSLVGFKWKQDYRTEWSPKKLLLRKEKEQKPRYALRRNKSNNTGVACHAFLQRIFQT